MHLDGQKTTSRSLSTLFDQQPLQLVFLNGCANQQQVKDLFEVGVPAVIATSAEINDELAGQLSRQFYQALAAGKTIRQAFDTAKSFIEQNRKSKVEIAYRGQKLDTSEEESFPWGLYCQQEAALDWSLEDISEANLDTITYQQRKIKKVLGPPPFIPEIFLGRDNDLEAIRQKLSAGDNLLLLVNGEGGIGKTTAAAAYYRRYQDLYQHVAWVFGGLDLQEALLTLAPPLQINFSEAMPNEQRLHILLEAMSNLDEPCLLVIDNANEIEELKKNYLALRSCPNFHVLVTTRITEFEQAASHRISHLKKKTAVTLFKKHYPEHDPAENQLLEAILAAVGYNTLVIELLARNLRNFNRLRTRYHLSDLLQDLQEKKLLALSHSRAVKTGYQADTLALREEKPEDIIAAMYDLSDLTSLETKLLSFFAVLPAENIAFELFSDLLNDTENLDDTLLLLAQKGWIDYDPENVSFKVSPVIQSITRSKHPQLFEYCQELIAGLSEKLDYQAGIGHFINATYEEASLFAWYAENLIDCLNQIEYSLGLLCERVGSYHSTTGNLDKALTFFEEYSRFNTELYEAYPQNVSFKNGLAISYE
ncbi:NB-ARC domain-containing protein, partial [Flavilitoribacter nigricans]|uniref:NB-ARC domain-containing protein n=1 Tax=Flavilitoribacter nigricans TaxID=70997 RepID=UPI001473DDEB